jgi:XTP/dITP diphosphohydrolase
MRGELGHGYDPIFVPDGFTQTFGQMDRWEKNRMSHRAVALGKLVAALEA